jgi:hypothetical protein
VLPLFGASSAGVCSGEKIFLLFNEDEQPGVKKKKKRDWLTLRIPSS